MTLVKNKPQKLNGSYHFTEGPAADANGNVYFTDQPANRIYCWSWERNEIRLFIKNAGRANGTFFRGSALITCSDEKGVLLQIDEHKNITTLATEFQGESFNGPNDLWIDEEGGIYFTDPFYHREYWEQGRAHIRDRNLYFRAKDGKVIKIDSFLQPNGIIGSNQLKKLYVSDIDAAEFLNMTLWVRGNSVIKSCSAGRNPMG